MFKVTEITELDSGRLELTSGAGSCVSTALTSTLRNSRHNHDMTTHNIDKVSASLADRKEAFHGKSRYMVEYRADTSGCMAVFSDRGSGQTHTGMVLSDDGNTLLIDQGRAGGKMRINTTSVHEYIEPANTQE